MTPCRWAFQNKVKHLNLTHSIDLLRVSGATVNGGILLTLFCFNVLSRLAAALQIRTRWYRNFLYRLCTGNSHNPGSPGNAGSATRVKDGRNSDQTTNSEISWTICGPVPFRPVASVPGADECFRYPFPVDVRGLGRYQKRTA